MVSDVTNVRNTYLITENKSESELFIHHGENMFQYIDSEKFINFTSVDTLNISATMIREWIHSRRSLRNLLPPSVEGIIIRRGLYGWEE